jgi:hypothetical protein
MIDEDLDVPWSAQMRIDVTRDPELLDLMRRTKCLIVYLGLESIHQETLDRYDKRQTVDDIVRALRTFREYGLKTHGMFVLGADTDDRRTVRDTVEFCMKNHVDTVQLNILTPLPGTPVFDELDAQGRIFEKRWHFYDAHHVVFTPRQMTPYELQLETLRGFMRFYSLRQWPRTSSPSASPSCSSRAGLVDRAPGAKTSATEPCAPCTSAGLRHHRSGSPAGLVSGRAATRTRGGTQDRPAPRGTKPRRDGAAARAGVRKGVR